jgi:hypothetical protein
MWRVWVASALAVWSALAAEEARPGMWIAKEARDLPLPSAGYQVYMLGEQHGIRENVEILAAFLEKLTATGLRDVAIEEDAAYEPDAQAYVSGQSDRLRPELCLRRNVFDALRRCGNIRVHLVDVDSPAEAIREHLTTVRKRVDPHGTVQGHDMRAVERLREMTRDNAALRALRTIEHSMRALQQGFEVGLGESKGSPYLEDREAAIAENIGDVARASDSRGVLAFYGIDHVSKSLRKDGGPKRDRPLAPTAMRLEQSGLKVFSAAAFPLEGRARWRGREGELIPLAEYGATSDGERLDRAWERWGRPPLVYVDPRREKMRLPTGDQRSFVVDAWIILARGSAMDDGCAR